MREEPKVINIKWHNPYSNVSHYVLHLGGGNIPAMIDGKPVAPTSLWRALLPLVWLFLGFAALGFLSAFAGLIPVWVWGGAADFAVMCLLAHYCTTDWEYGDDGYSEKYDRWRGEW